MKFIIKKIGSPNLKDIYKYLFHQKDGEYMIEVKKVRKKRSNDQNAWLWGVIYPMLLDGLVDAGWEITDTEQVHEFFKSQMTSDRVINKHTGEVIEIPESTANMDTLTFSTYCEKLREYASEFLGVDIPDPIEQL